MFEFECLWRKFDECVSSLGFVLFVKIFVVR